MTISLASLSAFAVVFAALVAGIFTYITALLNSRSAKLAAQISSENAKLQARLAANVKLAEFRQNWINALREDMSKFLALEAMYKVRKVNEKALEDSFDIAAKIKLRINSTDKNYEELCICMEGLASSKDFANLNGISIKYVRVCQDILRAEWVVLRDEVRGVCE